MFQEPNLMFPLLLFLLSHTFLTKTLCFTVLISFHLCRSFSVCSFFLFQLVYRLYFFFLTSSLPQIVCFSLFFCDFYFSLFLTQFRELSTSWSKADTFLYTVTAETQFLLLSHTRCFPLTREASVVYA